VGTESGLAQVRADCIDLVLQFPIGKQRKLGSDDGGSFGSNLGMGS
jgi:hypothetical protein